MHYLQRHLTTMADDLDAPEGLLFALYFSLCIIEPLLLAIQYLLNSEGEPVLPAVVEHTLSVEGIPECLKLTLESSVLISV